MMQDSKPRSEGCNLLSERLGSYTKDSQTTNLLKSMSNLKIYC